MHWFKIMLLVVIFSGIIMNLISIGKGNRTKESKAITEFICAVWGMFLLFGIFYWL